MKVSRPRDFLQVKNLFFALYTCFYERQNMYQAFMRPVFNILPRLQILHFNRRNSPCEKTPCSLCGENSTVELGYNDLGLCDSSFIMIYILWYQPLPHKACVFCPAQSNKHKSIYSDMTILSVIHSNIILQELGSFENSTSPHP